MVLNTIEKEVSVDAAQQVVWSVLTESEHIGKWFGNGLPARVDLRQGGTIVFDHGGHGDIPARIETLTPPTTLSYRWAVIGPPGEQPSVTNSTSVQLSLHGNGDTTTIHLTEAGFGAVVAPADELEARYHANDVGWDRTLGDLADYIHSLGDGSASVPGETDQRR